MLTFFKELQLETYRLLLSPVIKSKNVPLEDLLTKMNSLLVEQDYFGLLGINCHISHRICLSEQDIAYIMQTRILYANSMSSDQYQMLYPITKQWPNMNHLEQANIRALFDQILINIDGNTNAQLVPTKFDYQTERLHSILELIFSKQWDTPHTNTAIAHIDVLNKELFDLTNLNLSSTKPKNIYSNSCSRGNSSIIFF